MKLKTVLSILFFLLAAAAPAFADAKTMTVQVSCTVPAMMEMAATQTKAIEARTNLNNQYQMTSDMGSRDGRRAKVYSLTAL